jgi:hypothetical protein
LKFRRVDALKDELHRIETMTHLTKEEKEFLVKEKQDVLFKSVRFYIKFTSEFFVFVYLVYHSS